jgi:soluble lytic murein transglycosylase-like protein
MMLRAGLFFALLGAAAAAGTEALAASPAEEIDPALVAKLARALADDAGESDHFDAEVWLLSTAPKVARWVTDEAERGRILDRVYVEANRNDIDADLVLAVMQVESAFDRFAISTAGAQGLMQVMPFWRNEIGRPQDNLTDVDTNIRYGATILAHYLEVSKGDLIDALARYNGSRGRLHYPELVVYAYRATWQTLSNDELPELTDGCAAYGLAACGSIPRRR